MEITGTASHPKAAQLRKVMEITGTASHPKAPAYSGNAFPTKQNKNYNIKHRNNTLIKHPPIPIQLPPRRPKSITRHRQPVIDVKPQSKKSNPTPATTTSSDILYLMASLNMPVSLGIYISLAQECAKTGDSLKAIELYLHMRKGGVYLNLALGNRLLVMFVRCGCLDYGRHVFDEMSTRNFYSWAVMIAGYVENGDHREAMDIFIEMLYEEERLGDAHDDDKIKFAVRGIFVCALKACASTEDLELGMQIHGWLLKMGCARNPVLSSSLIKFYGKCKCCEEDKFERAMNVFREMGRQGVRKNSYTFSSVLKACGYDSGRQVHANAIKVGAEIEGYVQCALIEVYGRCGSVKEATKAFEINDNSEDSDSARWNAMLTAFVQNGLCVEAIKLVYKMKAAGFVAPQSLMDQLKLICGSRILQHD